MDAIKVEGGAEVVETASTSLRTGSRSWRRVGLHTAAGRPARRLQGAGEDARAARRLIEDALALEDAGAFSIVLESLPDRSGRSRLSAWGFRPSASARASTATVRCSCSTTCSAFTRVQAEVRKRYADIGGRSRPHFGVRPRGPRRLISEPTSTASR